MTQNYNQKEIEMMEHFFVEYKELYEKHEGVIINETFLKLYDKVRGVLSNANE